MAPRALNKLSAKKAENLRSPGRHSDGGGLSWRSTNGAGGVGYSCMCVVGGASSLDWAVAATCHWRRREPKQQRCAPLLAGGEDPKAIRRQRRSHPDLWRMCRCLYRGDAIRLAQSQARRPMAYDADDLLPSRSEGCRWMRLLPRTFWAFCSRYGPAFPRRPSGCEGASKMCSMLPRQRASACGENPARWRGHLDQLLPKRQRLTRGHHVALPYEDVSALMADLGRRAAVAARALEFTILTLAGPAKCWARPGKRSISTKNLDDP